MILTCPQCSTQFAVPPNAIKAEGRKVRCAKCKHVWHQYPVDDDQASEQTQEQEKPEVASQPDMAQAPLTDDDNLERVIDDVDSDADKETTKNKILAGLKHEIVTGYPSILVGLFVVLLGYAVIVMMHNPLVIGHGVIFENVEIERLDDRLKITGDLTNTMDDERGIPSIIATVYIDDIAGDSSIFLPPKGVVEAGSTVEFDVELTNYPENITDVRMGFVVED